MKNTVLQLVGLALANMRIKTEFLHRFIHWHSDYIFLGHNKRTRYPLSARHEHHCWQKIPKNFCLNLIFTRIPLAQCFSPPLLEKLGAEGSGQFLLERKNDRQFSVATSQPFGWHELWSHLNSSKIGWAYVFSISFLLGASPDRDAPTSNFVPQIYRFSTTQSSQIDYAQAQDIEEGHLVLLSDFLGECFKWRPIGIILVGLIVICELQVHYAGLLLPTHPKHQLSFLFIIEKYRNPSHCKSKAAIW